jgi:hypothetical protein
MRFPNGVEMEVAARLRDGELASIRVQAENGLQESALKGRMSVARPRNSCGSSTPAATPSSCSCWSSRWLNQTVLESRDRVNFPVL